MRTSAIILLLLLLSVLSKAQNELLKPGRVIFYNVENMFDTINDPDTKDEEFLPQGKNEWNTRKYNAKLEHISKVLSSLLDTIQPIVIGLAEIENHKVLEDLIAQPALQKFNFGIAHHDSPDERGIDVALLYNKDVINEVFDAPLKVEFSFDPEDKTREILYFKGFITEAYPIYFFVNHWPSRREANGDSEKKRITAAMVLKDKIEDIYKGESYARIVAMGDFNDNPDNKSMEYLVSGKYKYAVNQNLVNLMRLIQSKGEYTLKYQDENDVFDQFVVSKSLLSSDNTYYIRNSAAHIYNPSWIMFNHPKYGLIPNRTFAAGKWVNGYSDHLPVYFDICFH